MATNNAPEEDSVLIRLSVVQPGNIDHPERRILLTESSPIAQLGRSSSRPSLGLQPAVTNGWYNSPVMSRHHAQFEANFTNETVGIRDSGSMHGTFLNKNKIGKYMSQATRIRVGDELTLGMPVFRNREEFQPALVRVDGVEFHEASRRPKTTPTRTFTVPDDCSTDDNEPLDEASDEAGTNVAMAMADDELTFTVSAPNQLADSYQPQAEDRLASHLTSSPPHQLDGASGEISAPSDTTIQSTYLRVGDGQLVQSVALGRDASLVRNGKNSAGLFDFTDDLTDIDDGDQDEDHDDNPDMDSLHDTDIDLDTNNTNHDDTSRSPSWNSFSSDFEDEDMNDDSVLEDSASEGFAMFEDDSDDLVSEAGVDGAGQFDADVDVAQQPVHGLRVPPLETGISRAPTLPVPCQRLPPISSVIPAGPNNWISHSHSNWGARSPSPSDAVLLPSRRRADVAGGENSEGGVRFDTPDRIVFLENEIVLSKAQVTTENSAQNSDGLGSAASKANATICEGGVAMQDRPAKGHMDVNALTTLAQKSGKVDFFAARAFNKKAIDENTRLERVFGNPDLPPNNESETEMNIGSTKTTDAVTESSGFVLGPRASCLTGQGTAKGVNHHPGHTDAQRRSAFEPESHHKAAAWATFDPSSWEPPSAYELQYLKQQSPNEVPLRTLSWPTRNSTVPEHVGFSDYPVETPLNMDVSTSTDVEVSDVIIHTFEHLEQQSQIRDEREPSVMPTGSLDAKKGKRKAAEISEEAPEEADWADSVSSDVKSNAAVLSEAVQSSSHSISPLNNVQTRFPSPPPSPEERANPEQRPTKKLKKIAERVGYAALGGVSVGAMVLTSLIYTAPSFV